MTESNFSQFGHPKGKVDANGVWQVSTVSVPFHLKLAVDYSTADAAVLYTVPAGTRLLVEQAFWDVVTPFTGGTSAAIGVSSGTAPHDTKGDILGGAAGDLTATLGTAGATQGTVGVSYSAAPKLVVLEAGATVRFDRVANAYTAGAGFVHLVGRRIEV